MSDTDPIPDFLKHPGPPVMRQTDRQTKPDQPAKAPARKRGGRPRKARGAATSTDKAAARWTVRGVPVNVREIATKAAENRGMTVGDWISEAVVAFSKADTNRVSADVPTVVTVDDMKDMQARLTKLETRDTRGLLGKLFGKSTTAALLLAVLLISGTAWAQYTAFGAGQESCGFWTKTRNDPGAEKPGSPATSFVQWTGGYLTAYSRWVEEEPGPVSDSDTYGAVAWIDNYCRDNPLRNVARAAEALIYAIKDN